MAETVTEEEKEFTITNADGSTTTIKGSIITTDHGVTDKDGNPKISVHINAPVASPRTPEELAREEN